MINEIISFLKEIHASGIKIDINNESQQYKFDIYKKNNMGIIKEEIFEVTFKFPLLKHEGKVLEFIKNKFKT